MRLLALKTLSSILFLGLMAYSLAGFADHRPNPTSSPSLSSWYASVRLGYGFKPTTRVDDAVQAAVGARNQPANMTLEYGSSFVYGGAIGYLQDRIGVELEATHRNSKLKTFSTSNEGDFTSRNGRISLTPIMLNFYYHFLNFFQGHANLYAGAGMGLAFVNNRIDVAGNFPNLTPLTSTSYTGSLKSHSFAYQLILGMAYQISKSFSIGLEDRYFVAPLDTHWQYDGNLTVSTLIIPDSITYRIDQYHSNMINLVFTYYFS
ncbi:MAG: porin family protein [Coxiellaceae bacterium]|nr:porin family protein [Coxiellaceae bacterium]